MKSKAASPVIFGSLFQWFNSTPLKGWPIKHRVFACYPSLPQVQMSCHGSIFRILGQIPQSKTIFGTLYKSIYSTVYIILNTVCIYIYTHVNHIFIGSGCLLLQSRCQLHPQRGEARQLLGGWPTKLRKYGGFTGHFPKKKLYLVAHPT